MVYYGDNGREYVLAAQAGKGGVGTVSEIKGDSSIVAKIFHKRDKDRDEKIEALRFLYWTAEAEEYLVRPQVVLFEDPKMTKQCGYIMENIAPFMPLTEAFSGRHTLSIRKRAVIAEELCKAVYAIQHNGRDEVGSIVLGDFNFNNIAVKSHTGKIKIMDCDSLHLKTKKNGKLKILPCTELYEDFFMPELLTLQRKHNNAPFKQLSQNGFTTFTIYTDYYCLAYHIHMLLLGCSPFSEKPISVVGGKSVPVVHAGHDLAVTANYCYTNLRSDAELPAYCPSFDVITPELQKLFKRAFEDGASDPTKRPRPEEFRKAIEEYVSGLQYCNCDSAFDHYLYKSYNKNYCEWCRIDKENHTKKRIDKGDINYMTNKELEHMCDLSFVSNDLKAMAYLELALRHIGKAKIMIDGNMPIPSVVDKQGAQKLSKKAYAIAESQKLKDFSKKMMLI